MAARRTQRSGCGDRSEPSSLIIGRITRPHGIRGEVRVEIHTGDPERFFLLEEVIVSPTAAPVSSCAPERSRSGVAAAAQPAGGEPQSGGPGPTGARAAKGDTAPAGVTEARAVQVERVRLHQGVAILKLAGCDSRNDAETLRGHWLQVPIEQAIPLEEDEYYLFQLVGLEVRTAEGEVLGELAEVLQTGANDVFVVRGPAGELLLPDIPQVIQEIDLEAGRMLVQLAPGLRDG